MLDVLVVGGGPAGRAVAACCGERGLRTRVLDISPGRTWRATYGAWFDELPGGLPSEVIAAQVRGRAIAATEHDLGRDYTVLNVTALREYLDARLDAASVPVVRGLAERASLPEARVVIDAGGGSQPLAQRQRLRVQAEQTAVGVIVATEVAEGLVQPGEALFMDWRAVPGAPAGWPTFLYAVPLGRDRVLLEETSLARRPGLGFDELTARLHARLAHHGIRPSEDADRELVRFPLDVLPHRTPGVLGFGAAAPLTHPATGYQLATALTLAPRVADALAENLDADAARRVLWPPGARATHALRRRGLECLLRLPAEQVPRFFEGFFRLPARRQRDYLSGRDDPLGTAGAMCSLFSTTDWTLRLRLIGSSLLVSAPPRSYERSSME
ncbi:lycopene cyclase family protein [Pseudonocardia spinosispora]|uniref:lycopene cyclase family protein n=1 Tax=Pseudonocardia spinosispora TaxID=103441 RepID=UPI0004905F93|nr:lycopene cyclase family protein [Pseudonocardia spinosispora]